MNPTQFFLFALAAFVLVIVPALAIIALVRVRNFEKRAGRTQHPGAVPSESSSAENLRRLELRIQGMEKALERLYAQLESAPSQVAPPSTPQPHVTQQQPTPARVYPEERRSPYQPPSIERIPSPGPEEQRAAETAQPPAIAAPLSQSGAPASPKHIVYTSPEYAQQHAHRDAAHHRDDIESVVAGKWLNYVGIIAVLFSVAFFIEYAFENNWIGPRGRIAIGILSGAALIEWSALLLRRGYKYFSEGIAALGAAVLYLSL